MYHDLEQDLLLVLEKFGSVFLHVIGEKDLIVTNLKSTPTPISLSCWVNCYTNIYYLFLIAQFYLVTYFALVTCWVGQIEGLIKLTAWFNVVTYVPLNKP